MKNANAHRFSHEQIEFVGNTCKEWLNFFGYTKLPSDPNNVTGFFEFDGNDDDTEY